MKTFQELLNELNACSEAVEWASNKTIEDVVNECHRGDWLLWLSKKIEIPIRPLTLAKARCAKTVIHLMKDQRSINAVNIAERFGLDECTFEELYDAAAYAAYAAAYDADAAAYAAYAAAAYDADADADADAAAYAAYAADAADADAADADAAATRIKNKKQTADICREILADMIINKVNELLK